MHPSAHKHQTQSAELLDRVASAAYALSSSLDDAVVIGVSAKDFRSLVAAGYASGYFSAAQVRDMPEGEMTMGGILVRVYPDDAAS